MTQDVIDLTRQIEEGMPNSRVHPRSPLIWMCYTHGTTRFLSDETDFEGLSPSFMNDQILIGGHTGTHVDAPIHVDPNSDQSTADLSLDKLHGRGVTLDVRELVEPGEALQPSDLRKAEEETGTELTNGDIVLLRTGWAERYYDSDPDTYLDSHPGISPDAADWLVGTREIDTLGIDAPNVESHATYNSMAVHNRFYRQERDDPHLIIENLANLSALSDPVNTITAYPPPVSESTGFPVRVVAHPE